MFRWLGEFGTVEFAELCVTVLCTAVLLYVLLDSCSRALG